MPQPLTKLLMRNSVLAVVLAALTSLPLSKADAQREFVQHQRTATPATSRYELIQSTQGVRNTFRLDKTLGHVDQMVLGADSILTWERISRLDHPAGDPQVPAAVNYQLFISGLGIRYTFLMNVNNGATWQVVTDKNDVLVWQPFAHEATGGKPGFIK